MTVKYYAILTNQGAARLANATMLGSKLNLTQMAVGDANGVLPTPDPAQTKLINQKRIAPLNLLSVDPNNQSQIIAEQIIPENEGGFWIREIGLYDDEGVLIAVANCPETYKPQLQEGSGRTQTIRMILVVTNTEAITLKIDPSVVLATRKYVDDKISEHEQSRRHPDASLTVKGFTQLSSAINSESETLAATPKAVKAAYDLANGKYTAQNATTTQKGIVQLSSATNSTSETLAATPKAVKVVMDETNKKAPLNSPALTGTPTTPTAPQGTNNAQIASTAFVMAAIAALVDSSPDALNTLNELAAALGNDPLCIRSYRVPSDAGDETVRVMKDRTYTYDQAVSAIALMAQGHSQVERFVRGLCAIVGSGGSEGSVPFFVNRMSAQTSSQYYRTGNAAWVAYALAYYLLKYPDGEMAVVARDKLMQCAEWIEMFRVTDGSDVRSGLYTSGSGQYLNGVFYPDFDADWCTSEHQFDLWFLFDLMGRLGFTGYAEKAKALADAIMEKLWVEDEGRFYAGMRTTGVDKASPLDCASWGGLFVANIDMEKARRCFTYLGRLWYATHDATGYTPYHPEYGYPNKQRGVWVEGSAGVALLARRLGDDTTAMDILARLAPLRTRYGYIDSCDYPDNDDMPPWPSSCNTAWMILACDPQGFWNVNSPVLPGRYYKY